MPGARPPGRSGKGAGRPGAGVFLKYSDERGFSPFARLSLEISTSGRWVSGGGATPHTPASTQRGAFRRAYLRGV